MFPRAIAVGVTGQRHSGECSDPEILRASQELGKKWVSLIGVNKARKIDARKWDGSLSDGKADQRPFYPEGPIFSGGAARWLRLRVSLEFRGLEEREELRC